jgi:hypothetical protein
VRVPDLQIYVFLIGVFGLDGGSGIFDGSTVTNTVEAEDGRVAFADAEDVVLEVGTGSPYFSVRAYIYFPQVKVYVPHIALCFASVESFTVRVGPGSAGSWFMFTYVGIGIESSPSGPLICTVDIGCMRALRNREFGCIILNVTPGGTDSGADPIFDWHGEVVVKLLPQAAGVRNTDRHLSIDSGVMR